jgi:transketolase
VGRRGSCNTLATPLRRRGAAFRYASADTPAYHSRHDGKRSFAMNPLLKLNELGQSYWMDNLTRQLIQSGELTRRARDEGLRGITSNPKTFHEAIVHHAQYDLPIRTAVSAGLQPQAIYEQLVVADVRDACDELRGVYDYAAGMDGFVSLEVSPHLAHDVQRSIDEGLRLFGEVARPNCLIKIPGTIAGLAAIEQLLFEGVNVNVTLLFSVERYEAVAEAYLRALERRLEKGRPIDSLHSVASFFLSRIDVLVDRLLRQRIRPPDVRQPEPQPERLLGRVAVANAKVAYQHFQQIVAGDRWRELQRRGARPQRLLWASTSTKNPSYSDVMYVEPLIGQKTVTTMPETTIAAFADHGRVSASLGEGLEAARQVMGDLEKVGIDFAFVAHQLENEGIQKFVEPYDDLLASIADKTRRQIRRRDLPGLQKLGQKLRAQVIRMTTQAGSGHPTSCMSCADLIAVLFFQQMRWDPADPQANDVDQFVLSKGHAAPILWAVLSEAGAIDEDPMTLRRDDSTLEGHPTPRNPWVRVGTGSLGQGLAAANGMALAHRLDGIEAKVYCLLGDGECSEGSVWEAAQFASLQGLSGVVAIVDVNALGQSTQAPYRHHAEVFEARFQAFGWRTIVIDGHAMTEVSDALDEAGRERYRPTAIIARTTKGKGVGFLEGKDGWHGKPLDAEQRDRALVEIGDTEVTLKVQARRAGGPRRPPNPVRELGRVDLDYDRSQRAATRDGFGTALARLGESYPDLVVLDGDVCNSTRADAFAKRFPARFFQGYIAEQNLTGVALGLAASGKRPVFATFSAFMSRAYDFIRMAGHSSPEHLIFVGSHSGVSVGEDGPSQMGLEDMAMFRAIHGSTVLYPCDAVSAERLTEVALATPGIVYLRTTRSKTPVLYDNGESFAVGGSKVLTSSKHDELTIVAAGITVFEALAAYQTLKERGILVRVIDAYSIKPLDVGTLKEAASTTGQLVVVEDHWPEGGLGDAVAMADLGAPVHRLAVFDEPRSGSSSTLLERQRISRQSIVAEVIKLRGGHEGFLC